MVDFSFNNASKSSPGGVSYTTASSPSSMRTIYNYDNSVLGDPLTWSQKTGPTPFRSNILPNLKLLVNPTRPVFPSVTGNFTSGEWTGPITLTQPATAVTLLASDGSGRMSESSSFEVMNSSTDASLTSLVLSNGTLAEVFTSTNTSYTSSVSSASAGMTLTPVSADASATIKVRVNDGTYSNVTSASPSASLTLAGGANTIEVLVTAQDTVTTRTYSIAVTRRTPFQDWTLASGLSGAGTGQEGDPDADGLKNIQEWAFGTNPTAGSGGAIQMSSGVLIARGAPAVFTMPDGQGGVNLYALFCRRKDAGTVGLTYAVEFSDNATAWTVSDAIPEVIAQDSEIETVVVPFPHTESYPPKTLFRVRVTGQ
jgi:hypothetical protein